MKKNSSFYEDVNLEEESDVLCAKTMEVLFSVGLYLGNLDSYYKGLEKRVGKENFKKILESVDGEHRITILSNAKYISEMVFCVKRMMFPNNSS